MLPFVGVLLWVEQTKCILAVPIWRKYSQVGKTEKRKRHLQRTWCIHSEMYLIYSALKSIKPQKLAKLNSVEFVDEKISFFLLFSTVFLFCPLIYPLLFLLSFARIHKGTKINSSLWQCRPHSAHVLYTVCSIHTAVCCVALWALKRTTIKSSAFQDWWWHVSAGGASVNLSFKELFQCC